MTAEHVRRICANTARALLVLAALGILLVLPGAGEAATWYVTEDGNGSGTGGWENAAGSADLRGIIGSAGPGDQVWIAAGEYRPTTGEDRNIWFSLTEGVAVYGGFPAGGGAMDQRDPDRYETSLSGNIGDPATSDDNSTHVIYCDGVASRDAAGNPTLLDGVTVTEGNAEGGGGIYLTNSSLTFTDCTFSNNNAGDGGGVYNGDNSTATFTGCTFSGNSTRYGDGGGVYNDYDSTATLTGCTFSSNSADDGGGVCNRYNSTAAFSDCTFSNNSADGYGGGVCNYYDSTATLTGCTFSSNSADGYGGGVCNYYDSTATLTGCTFSSNSADDGGAVCNYSNRTATFTGCTFANNSATSGSGGGICNRETDSSSLTNCTFSGNSAEDYGGAIYNDESDPRITNCTATGNSAAHGSGMYNLLSSPTVLNSIFWDERNNEIVTNTFTDFTVTYSVVSDDSPNGLLGAQTAAHNTNSDPLLQGLADNGGATKTCALTEGSPAMDTASPDAAPMFDQRGMWRPSGPGYDIGAYELVQQSYTVRTYSNTGGTISPDNPTRETPGDIDLEVLPDTGYEIEGLVSGDTSGNLVIHEEISEAAGLSTDYPVTMRNVDSPRLLSADFRKQQFEISVDLQGEGAVEISKLFSDDNVGDYWEEIETLISDDVVSAEYSDTLRFDMYGEPAITLDGEPQGQLDEYIFTDISASHRMVVNFTPATTPTPAPPWPTATPTSAPEPTEPPAPEPTTAPTAGPTGAPTATPTPEPVPEPEDVESGDVTPGEGTTDVEVDEVDQDEKDEIAQTVQQMEEEGGIDGEVDKIRSTRLRARLTQGGEWAGFSVGNGGSGLDAQSDSRTKVLVRNTDTGAWESFDPGASADDLQITGDADSLTVKVKDQGVYDRDGEVGAVEMDMAIVTYQAASPSPAPSASPTEAPGGGGGGCSMGLSLAALLLVLVPGVLALRR